MKSFSQSDITYLNDILNICSLVDIDALIITEKAVRGVNMNKTSALLVNQKIPQLDGSFSLGLTKLKMLRQRLNIFKQDAKFTIDAKPKSATDNAISLLEIKGTSAKVQFRATDASKIKAPVAVEDSYRKSIILTKEEANLMLNAEKAMGSKKVTIRIDKNNAVSVQYVDAGNDVFSLDLSNSATSAEGFEKSPFTAFYFTDVFSPLLKEAIANMDQVEIHIYEVSAKINVYGYDVLIFSPNDSD